MYENGEVTTNLSDAISVLETLCDARDTEGKAVDRRQVIEQEQTIDALRFALETLKNLGSAKSISTKRSKSGFAWSSSDDESLTAEYDAGRSIEEIATMLNRTPSSVYNRLAKLGRNIDY